MRFGCVLLCTLTVLVPVLRANGEAAPAEPVPHWIWLAENATDNQEVIFRKSFGVRGKLTKATLYAAADNHMEVRINARKVLAGSDWARPVKQDVTEHAQGGGLLAVWARNDGGPAGLLLKLVLETDQGVQVVVSDGSWKVTDKLVDNWTSPYASDADWPHAEALRALGAAGTWETVTAKSLAEAPTGPTVLPGAIPAEEISLLPGFKAELLYSIPRWEGSWVSLTIDDKGRLIASDQYGALYRITPPAIGADPESAVIEKLDIQAGFAHGLLYAFESLYLMRAEGEGYGLYRLRDTNGDDQFDEVRLLKALEGAGEHGPHGIVLAPDGRSLYIVAGNHTKVPEGFEDSRVPRVWDEDHLLPRHWDANGHAQGVMAPGGWIAKTDPNGEHWEITSIGMRNTYDVAFNEDGELFGYDSDMEWDWGMPWYRPTRIGHHASGSDFGWRSGTSKWPEYYPDGYPAVVNIGMGSPTGVLFGTGAAFPAKYQRAMYALDWTYGKLYAVHLEADGAGYRGTFEQFAAGRPLPLTDAIIGRDGALYFTIGGRRVQSGLYRVLYTGDESTALAPPLVPGPDVLAARAIRKQLEFFHGQTHPQAVETAWPHLGSADRYIRYAARVAVEHQPVDAWRSRALSENRPPAIIEAMIALSRHGEASDLGPILDRLSTLPLGSLPEQQVLAALRAYGLAMIRLGRPGDPTVASLGRKFDAMYPAASALVNRELCQLVVYLEAPNAVSKSLKLMLESPTQEDQVHYAFTLRNAKTGWTIEQRKTYFQWMHHAIAKYSGGASFTKFVSNFRQDAIGTLTDAEKVALKEILEAPPEYAQPVAAAPRRYVFNWRMEDIEPLLDQTRSGRSFENGKAAFAAARCYECHRFAGEGGSTGPDLTGAGSRFSARDLLEQIIHPSSVISDQYADTDFILTDGQVITGRVERETSSTYLVRTDPLAIEAIEVFKEDIDRQALSRISKMPEDLLSTLEKEDVLDLISFLRAGGDANDGAFRNEPRP